MNRSARMVQLALKKVEDDRKQELEDERKRELKCGNVNKGQNVMRYREKIRRWLNFDVVDSSADTSVAVVMAETNVTTLHKVPAFTTSNIDDVTGLLQVIPAVADVVDTADDTSEAVVMAETDAVTPRGVPPPSTSDVDAVTGLLQVIPTAAVVVDAATDTSETVVMEETDAATPREVPAPSMSHVDGLPQVIPSAADVVNAANDIPQVCAGISHDAARGCHVSRKRTRHPISPKSQKSASGEYDCETQNASALSGQL